MCVLYRKDLQSFLLIVKVAYSVNNSQTPTPSILDHHHMATISLWHHAQIYGNNI